MANPTHVELVRQGVEAIRQWQEEHQDEALDLAESDLHGADLGGADLRHADLCGANLVAADLTSALLTGANLAEAELEDADLTNANLVEAKLTKAELWRAFLVRANLTSADLSRAQLLEIHMAGSDWHYANLSEAVLPAVWGIHRTSGLETTQLTVDVQDFWISDLPWPERWLDWERLRVVGRLPLFGASYTALILIPIVFYVLALYNDKIELVRAWAEQSAAMPDSPLQQFAPLVLDRLHLRPIPSLSFVLLVSTILLAAGSTLYTFFCPSRIKEFSRDQWCDQLGRSLLHYWPLAWKHRAIRLVCAACYALGGLSAAWVLGTKVGKTAWFILQHSAFSWPWR